MTIEKQNRYNAELTPPADHRLITWLLFPFVGIILLPLGIVLAIWLEIETARAERRRDWLERCWALESFRRAER
ncbi:MAG: hypothetical protein ACFB2W_01005 [Leptolyngbyaceae cyanobacterium]